MGCGETFMKLILHTVNVILLLAAGIMLGFGITGKVNAELIGKIFSSIIRSDDMENLNKIGINLTDIIVSNSTFMIVLGSVGVAIAIFGIIGTCCMVQLMLVTYAVLLVILLLAEIALIIYAAVAPNSFKSTIQDGMYTSLKDGFKNEITINQGNITLPSGVTELSWAQIQLTQKCCGARNYTDYASLTKWNRTVSAEYTNVIVPVSCCLRNTGSSTNSTTQFVNLDSCLKGSKEFINSVSCYDALEQEISKFLSNNKGIAIGIAAAVCGLELILIIFSFALCSIANRSDKVV